MPNRSMSSFAVMGADVGVCSIGFDA